MHEPTVLGDWSDMVLDQINNLPIRQKVEYVEELIAKYYPHLEKGTEDHTNLLVSYINSFITERTLRDNEYIRESFTAIYTKTGLIREIVNDLYYTHDDSLITH